MFRRLYERLDTIDNQIALIDRMLLIKDPGAARAADAYEGLRKQLIAAVQERRAHLADLARIDAALEAGETTDDLRLLMCDLLGGAGLQRVTDASLRDCYEVIAGDGEMLDVVAAAYVDTGSGQLIRQGRAQTRAVDGVPQDSEPADDTSATSEVIQ